MGQSEEQTLRKTESYGALFSQLEPELIGVTLRAMGLCGTEYGFISFLREESEVIKISCGLEFGSRDVEVSRENSLVRQVSECGGFLAFEASQVQQLLDNVSSLSKRPIIQFAAGVPLVTPEGLTIGMLLVADSGDKIFASSQKDILKWAAKNIIDLFEHASVKVNCQRVQQQFLDMQRIVQAGSWELDVATGNTHWSDQIYEIYQIPIGTPTGKLDGLAFYAPDERQKLSQLIDMCIHQKQPFDNIFEFHDANGLKKWVRSIGRPLEGPSGSIVKVIGTFQDVTRQVEKEKESLTVKQGLDAYALAGRTDPQGRISYVNDRFCEVSQYSKAEVIGQDLRVLSDGHDPGIDLNDLSKCSNEKKAWRGEVKNKTKNGDIFWVDATIMPSVGTSGGLEGFVFFMYDITERKKLDQSLADSQNRYKQIFSQAKDAMMTLELPNWQFSSCNAAALGLFDVASEEEFKGLGPWNLSPIYQSDGLLSSEKAKRMIEIAMSSGSHFFEWIHCTRKGREFPSTVRLSRIDEGGRSYLQATVRDVSERKNLEKKVLDMKELLDLAVEGGGLGIWDWSLVDNSVTYNESWARMRGLELIDLNMNLSDWESRVHPEDLPRAHEAIDEYLSGKTKYYECLHRIRHQEGRWIHIMGRGRFSEWDKDGKPIRFTGTDMDLTELVASKEKLDLFFNRAPFGFAFCDLEGKFIECNSEFERLTGYSIDELNQLAYWDLTPEIYSKEEENQLELLKNKGEYGPYRKEYRTKHGELVPVELTGFLVEDYSGQKGIWSIVEDITEKKRSEEEKRLLLLEQDVLNQKLNAIFRFSPAVVYECQVNRNWTMTFINSHIEELTGYPAEDFINDKAICFGDLIHPDDVAYVERGVQEALRKKQGYDLTYRVQNKNGSIKWVWERGAQAPSSESLIGVLFDVTENKRSEAVNSLISDVRAQFIAAAGNKNQFYSSLLERVMGAYGADFGGIVEVESGEILADFKLLDRSTDQIVRSLSVQDMFGMPEYGQIEHVFNQTIAAQENTSLKDISGFREFRSVPVFYNTKLLAIVALGNRGNYFSQEETVYFGPFYARLGEMIHEMNLAQDLETQKKISFHQSKLASIGELATGVAHEINNPLAIIQGQMETLKRYMSKSSLEDNVILQKTTKTINAVERIANIVKGLRTFARMDVAESRKLDLNPILSQTVEMLAEIYQKEGIEFRVELDEEIWVVGNSGRLQQVFVNLLNNARDALRKSEKKLIVLKALHRPGEVEVSVADTGPGIPYELKEKVFDPFFTTKEEGAGIGVGLALVSTIIREHEGTVDLDLNYKGGARLVVCLPSAAEATALRTAVS